MAPTASGTFRRWQRHTGRSARSWYRSTKYRARASTGNPLRSKKNTQNEPVLLIMLQDPWSMGKRQIHFREPRGDWKRFQGDGCLGVGDVDVVQGFQHVHALLQRGSCDGRRRRIGLRNGRQRRLRPAFGSVPCAPLVQGKVGKSNQKRRNKHGDYSPLNPPPNLLGGCQNGVHGLNNRKCQN